MLAEPSNGGMVEGLKEERDAEFYGAATPRTMLETLANERIIEVELFGKTTVCLTEGCDEYFSVDLTKAEFSRWIEELQALRDTMEE